MEPLRYPDLEDLRRKWQSPETSAALGRHMEEYYRCGVMQSYLAAADSMYPAESYAPEYAKRQAQISRLARAEVYLAATRLYGDEGDYYLERVNEETGFSVSAPDPIRSSGEIDSMVPVLRISSLGILRKIMPPFTTAQVDIVVKNTHELQEMGLTRPLYPSDSRYYDGPEL